MLKVSNLFRQRKLWRSDITVWRPGVVIAVGIVVGIPSFAIHPVDPHIVDGVAVISDGSRFAGSITPIHQMIKNLIDSGIDITDAVAMGTSTPANIIGVDNIGRIFSGYTADICILNEKFDIIDVFKDGKLMCIEH